jgi:hypothetical protein
MGEKIMIFRGSRILVASPIVSTPDLPDRRPRLFDGMVLVGGYAAAFVIGLRIHHWPLHLALYPPLFWQEGWRVWLRVVALGPLLAGPILWWAHRGDSSARGRIPGAAIPAVIGVMKLIQLGEGLAIHGLFGEYRVNLILLYLEATLVVAMTLISLLTRGWASGRWLDQLGLALGVAWSLDALANVYGVSAFPGVSRWIYVV